MPKGENERLTWWQEIYIHCKTLWDDNKNQISADIRQYEGSKETDVNGVRGSDAIFVRNITYELIESQVSSAIPQPKVVPRKQGDKYERNARTIEEMLRAQFDRLPMEYIHDEACRTVPVTGGNFFLVEWDNGTVTRNTVGDVSVQSISPLQFIPQEFVPWMHRMSYMFIEFEDTRDRLYTRYGKEIPLAIDEENTEARDTVTVVVCYYTNTDGSIGEFRWADQTILLDMEDCQARYWKVCEACGKAKPYNSDTCQGGSTKWVKQPSDYEELYEDITLSDGTVVPAVSPKLDDNGQPEIIDIASIDRVTGRAMIVQQPVMEPTRIPYYAPRRFPVILQKNTSKFGQLLGDSDCEKIHDIQQTINKLMSNIQRKLLSTGSVVTIPEDLEYTPDDEIGLVVRVKNQAQVGMITHLSLAANVQQDLQVVEQLYNSAKRILGISDSYQGMADTTAQSGTAKQIQVRQSAGRLESKRVMTNSAYADLYQTIFQFMLAYCDEPRDYMAKDEKGQPVKYTFNRYNFLERDAAGQWYYDDEYLFSTDISSTLANDRQALWQEARQNYTTGAFGDPAQTSTRLFFWREMESLHYPNASQIVKFIEQLQQDEEQMQQMQAQLQQSQQASQQYAAQAQGLAQQVQQMNGTLQQTEQQKGNTEQRAYLQGRQDQFINSETPTGTGDKIQQS
jgi:hypothetical protein